MIIMWRTEVQKRPLTFGMSGLDSFCVVSLLDHSRGNLFIIKYLLMLSTTGRRLSLRFQWFSLKQAEVERRESISYSGRGACEPRWGNHAVFSHWLLWGMGFLHHVRVMVRGLRLSEHAWGTASGTRDLWCGVYLHKTLRFRGGI